MSGMNAQTGAPITGLDHLRQSVSDILTTPRGSRVMRRDYGSLVPLLVDAPANEVTTLLFTAVVADALAKWEPRIALDRVRLAERAADGRTRIDLDVIYKGAPLSLAGVVA